MIEQDLGSDIGIHSSNRSISVLDSAEERSHGKYIKDENHSILTDEVSKQVVEKALNHLRSSLVRELNETSWMYTSGGANHTGRIHTKHVPGSG